MTEGRACVGVVATEFPPQLGGIGTLASDYVRWMSRVRSVVLFVSPDVPADPVVPQGVRVVRLGVDAVYSNYRKILESGVKAVLFSHMYCAPPLLVILLKLHGIKMATLVHGMDVRSQPKMQLKLKNSRILLRLKAWLSFALQNRVIANSRFTLETFRKRYFGLDGCVVHPGIWLNQTISSGAKAADVISVGRLVARKGVDVMLKALGGLEGVTATVVGDGPELGAFQKTAQSPGLDNRVHFTGGLAHADALAEVARHRIFCLLPRELEGGDVEGFGIVFLEAASLGLPVIAGKSGGVPDAVNDGVNGFLVDPTDPVEVAEKIRLLLDDPVLYSNMSRASLAWAEKFDWNRRDPSQEIGF
jgi:glycosyltransferase involved in cell wall biosynthesis